MHDAQGLASVDLSNRHGRQGAVSRQVEIVRGFSVGPGVHRLPLAVRIRNADEGADAVEGAHAPQAAIGLVEDEFADPRVLQQHPLALRLHVKGHEIAPARVVGRIEQGAGRGVEGERRYRVRPGLLDLVQLFNRAAVERDRAEVAERAGIVHAGVDRAAPAIDVGARQRPECLS